MYQEGDEYLEEKNDVERYRSDSLYRPNFKEITWL